MPNYALSLIVSIVGLLMYVFVPTDKHPHVSAPALYAFAVGLLVFLLLFGPVVLPVFRH